MPPKKDVTQNITCRICHVNKPPECFAKCNTRKNDRGVVVGYSLRTECKDCGNERKAAATEAKTEARIAALPRNGTKRSAREFELHTWTVNEGSQKNPRPRKQEYVLVADISPTIWTQGGFLDNAIPAAIINSSGRVAHASGSADMLFVALEHCLEVLGLRKCTKCDKVKARSDFSIANAATGQLRGECRGCHC